MQKKEEAILYLNNKKYVMPIFYCNKGNPYIDIQNLYAQTSLITYDPGLKGTAISKSYISYVDGNKGKLSYRLHDIEDINKKITFEELYGLLIFNNKEIRYVYEHISTEEEDCLDSIMMSFDYTKTFSMNILYSTFSYFTTCYMNDIKKLQDHKLYQKIISIHVAIISKIHRAILYGPYNIKLPCVDISKNFEEILYSNLLDNTDKQNDQHNQMKYDILKCFLITHAEHEQNSSTSGVISTYSAGADIISCIISGMLNLSGSKHGGANERCISMLEEISCFDNKEFHNFMESVKKKEKILMGVGHRIYKNNDPRSNILKERYQYYLSKKENKNSKLLETAMKIEDYIEKDEYFVTRKLFPNVDFYSGISLKEIGLDKKIFTPLFSLSRTVGWLAHIQEMMENPLPIIRPRQVFTPGN